MKVTKMEGKREMVCYEESDKLTCPKCGAVAVVPLTESQLAKQPDDTTHVCHPAFKGCNHGFAMDCKLLGH